MAQRSMAAHDADGARWSPPSRQTRRRLQWVRAWFSLVLGAVLVAALQTRAEAAYPERPIRLIVAFAPGGIADIIARMIGDKLGTRFGQNFVVENRGGAGGAIGAKVVSSASPDGYTLLITTAAVAINSVAFKGAVDPRSQLTPVALVASAPMIFATNRKANADDLMKYLRGKKDGFFTYSTSGVGTAEHLTSEYVFKVTPGLSATHVPFSGGVETINAVLGGQVDLTTTTVPPALAFLNDGSLRVLAASAHRRLPMLPDTPTLKEAGFPDLENASWIALFGPPNLPDDIAARLNGAVNDALKEGDINDRLTKFGFVLQARSQPEFASYLKDEVLKWGQIVKETGFSPN